MPAPQHARPRRPPAGADPAPDGDDEPAHRAIGRWGGRWPTVLAVVGLAVLAVLSLLPALIHGTVLAPFDMLSLYGLGHQAGVVPHNVVDSDLIQQDAPWLNLAWTQVHHGHLPLWNPDEGLGMPLGLDFVAAAFSLPTLVSYLAPLPLMLLVSVLVKLVIAGTGAYFLCRVLRMRHLGAFVAAAIFELSGAFTVWLGWSQTGVMAWLGWILGATFLVFGEQHRVRHVFLLAVVLALSVYGGHPESNVIAVATMATVTVVLVARRLPVLGGAGRILAPLVDLGIGIVAALGLSAPLWLPGFQLTVGTPRYGSGGYSSIPLSNVANFIFQGWDGLPISGSHYINPANYYEVTAFVGVPALVLAVVAVSSSWRRVETQALVAVVLVMTAIVFLSPVAQLVGRMPVAANIDWLRCLIPLSLGLAVLAGMGFEALLDHGTSRRYQRTMLAAFGVAALALIGFGIRAATSAASLPAETARTRAHSFFWPVLQTLVGLAVVTVWVVLRRRDDRQVRADPDAAPVRRRGVVLGGALLLLASELAFLILADGPLWSPNQQYFPRTAAEASLQQAVGGALVGFGSCPSVTQYADLGILPDANVGYHVHQFSFYETAVVPKTYYQSWAAATGQPVRYSVEGVFCPSISTVALARRYGVGFILEPAGTPGPPGTDSLGTVGDERLYAVPHSGPATLSPVPAADTAPGGGTLVRVAHPDDATWQLRTHSPSDAVLFLRLTDVPGWHATVDGRPAAVHRWDAVMADVDVPAGRHRVVLTYWPPLLDLGLLLAALTLSALVAAAVLSRPLARRRRHPPASADAADLDSKSASPAPTV